MDGADGQRGDWHWMWSVYIAGVCGVAAVACFLLDGLLPGRSPVAAAVILGLMLTWLVAAGRAVPKLGELSWRPVLYICVTAVLWILAMWFSPAAFIAIPALYPVVFSTLPLPAGVVAAVLITLIPLTLDIATTGLDSAHLPIGIAMTLLGLVAGPIIGIMVVNAVRQRILMADLIAELEATRAQSARLSRETGAATERQRLAHEIHDTLAQGYTSIIALAQAVEAEMRTDPAAAARHIALIDSTARANLSESRTMVSSLTPAALDDDSIAAAIRRQCENFAAETGVPVALSAEQDLPASAMASSVVLLRAAQESLSNIRRHARATAVTVRLSSAGNRVRLTLSDNGVGLCAQHQDGFGLRGMRARAAQVGGTLTISEAPQGGVTVLVEVPT
jgi:signal transduction histidine kinase